MRGCTDVPRLHAAAGVLCQVASLAEPVRSGALCSALLLLGNRYPKVRRASGGGGGQAGRQAGQGVDDAVDRLRTI